MDTAKLISLRPKGASVEEHEAALGRIDGLMTETLQRITQQKELRPKILLTASVAQIQDLERNVAELELDLERLQAMQVAILPQLELAKIAKKHADVREIVRKAKVEHNAYGKWVKAEYPALTEKLLAGFGAGDRAIGACMQAMVALTTVPDVRQQILDEVGGLTNPPNPGAETVLVKALDEPQGGSGYFTVWRGERSSSAR